MFNLNKTKTDKNGTISHTRWGQLHRKDGPALEWIDGTKEWYINGQKHREDGPAVEWSDGTKYWWIKHENISEEEFNNRLFKKNFKTL